MAKKKMLSDEEAFEYFDKKTDSIFDKIDEGGYSGLSKHEKMIYLMIGFESGVRNGGLGGYLGNPHGQYVEDLISFLRDINVGAIAKDVETLVRDIQSFFPAFPKESYYEDALGSLPKDRIQAHKELEKECTSRLWEYPSVLPYLYDYIKSSAK